MRDPIQPVFRERVQADWIDYNGHLNEAFYLLIFSHATDELIDRIGMDAGYREREKRSIYTLETHILYALEVKQGVEVEVRTRLLDLDGKRIRISGYMLRHKVKPGITGLAQVNGWRGETETLEKMERRIEFDHRYIREWSLFMDFKILLQTIVVVLRQENAY